MTDDEFKAAVKKLMFQNKKEGYSYLLREKYCYVMPSPGSYPFQWFWDTCFNIFTLCAIEETELAKKSLRSLFKMQHDDGFVGHMIFWKSIIPKNKLNILQSKPSLKEFRPHMSSLIQPSLVAQALECIFNETNDVDFVLMMLPKLKKYFEWLSNNRDISGDGLISIISVFESGIDWKPSYDEVLGFPPAKATEKLFKKAINIDFKNFMHGYNLKKIFHAGYFEVREMMVNTMYAKDLQTMASLCERVNDADADKFNEWSLKVSRRIYDVAFDKNQIAFFDVYGKDNKQSKTLTFTIALPLLLADASKELGQSLLKKHFLNNEEFALPYPIPSTALDEPAFDPLESKFLWRGPTWILGNWFLQKCFRMYGFHDEAHHLVEISKQLVEKHGFHEYYNPFTAEPYGAKNFTWGGLVLDMMRSDVKESMIA